MIRQGEEAPAPPADEKEERPWLPFSEASGLRAILLLAIALRLLLALVNLEANDDHMAVSRVIAFEHRIPADDELYEAYHPKLYHGSVALLWRVLPNQSLETATRAAQLLNVAVGIATLLVVLRLLRQFSVSANARLACFALIALNPRLIAINAQAANDTFAIFFGTLALYFGYKFFERWSWSSLAGMCSAAVLMSLAKANGLILLIAILMTFGIVFIRAERLAAVGRGRIALSALAFVIVYFSTVPWLGPYARNVRDHGGPFVSNHDIAPFPDLWNETHYGRPGATSIVGGLMTFRFMNLLQRPLNTQHPSIYPAHRTSYWSQLYGRSHFAHFENHPPSWGTRNRWVKWLGRIIFVLALPPTVLLVAGGVQSLARTSVTLLGRSSLRQRTGDGLLVITIIGFVAAGALYALRQRTFASMNAIYVFPALPGFALFFTRGYQSFLDSRHGQVLSRGLTVVIGLLLTCYMADIAALIYQLR